MFEVPRPWSMAGRGAAAGMVLGAIVAYLPLGFSPSLPLCLLFFGLVGSTTAAFVRTWIARVRTGSHPLARCMALGFVGALFLGFALLIALAAGGLGLEMSGFRLPVTFWGDLRFASAAVAVSSPVLGLLVGTTVGLKTRPWVKDRRFWTPRTGIDA